MMVLWLQHARRFILENTDLSFKLFTVNYNEWFISESYRAEVCNRLPLAPKNELLDKVAPQADGSSFDGMEYDGNAQAMPVLERYKQMKFSKHYTSDDYRISLHPKIIKLSKKIFGRQFTIDAVEYIKKHVLL